MLLAELRLPQWFVDATTIFGILGTLIGLGLTLWQVRETKKAAEAARDAALATAEADRTEYVRFVISTCHRIVREAKIYVEHSRYELAAIRIADLADQIALVGKVSPDLVPGWETTAAELRNWEDVIRKCHENGRSLSPNVTGKWSKFLMQIYATIDQVHGPFNDRTGESE